MNKLVKYIVESKFNFNIDQLDIENNEGEFSLSKQQYKSKSMKQEYTENAYFVDLGLPSGTKWCKYNLGCDFALLSSNHESTSPEDWYGKYYAWGEIEEKDYYDWYSYKYAINSKYKLIKYCTKSEYGCEEFTDNLVELLPEDDAAYQMNHDWNIPSKEQYQELFVNTNNRWISGENSDLYMNVKGLAGRLFTSRINENQLFIPAAGCKYGANLSDDGAYCFLWSSRLSIDDPDDAWYLFFDSDSISMYYYVRCGGRSVRPVLL